MPVQTATAAECAECGAKLDVARDCTGVRAPCLICGSTVRKVDISLDIEGEGSRLGMMVKARRAGEKQPHAELVTGAQLSVALGKLVNKQREIDRTNDRYYEEVTEYETGRVLHLDAGKLSEHRGHGSAKPKKPKQEP